jgi:hypothetical protein
MSDEPKWIRTALSRARFAPYLAATGGNLAKAIQLYWWNVDVSSAFYPSLHCLEIAVRNSMHTQLGTTFGRVDWWNVASLRDNGLLLVNEATRKVRRRLGYRTGTADDMVTELSFGFWVSLVSRAYHRDLWVPCLCRALPGYRGRRDQLHESLLTVVLLRNRIMHHEPIHHRHLEADHETIYRLLGYVSPDLVTQLAPFDRVPKLLQERPWPTST